MAVDPRISLAAQPINLGQRFGQSLSNVANLDLIGQRREQAPFQNRLLELQTELTEAQQPGQLQVAQETASPIAQLNRRDKARLQSVVQGAQELSPLLEANDIAGARSQLIARKARLVKLNLPTETTDESLELLDSNPELLRQRTAQAITLGEQAGFLKGARASTPAGLQVFEALTEGLTGEDLDKARRIKLGLDSAAPKIFQSSAKTFNIGGVPHILDAKGNVRKITVDGENITTQIVALSEADIASAKAAATEEAKLTKQLKFKPQITRAVRLAEKAAAERGEVLTDLARMEASLPGITEVFNELVELSTVATSTFAGRLFDVAVKESGFGSTKGADARAKLIAIVDNQVLPLLRETFGAAFTVQEGENLKSSLVDPNASPSQKKQQLESFLAQKERNIRAKQSQLDAETQQLAPGVQKIGRFTVEVIE